MGWLFFVLLLLAVLPLGVWIRYDEAGPLVRIVAGPLKITVFPVRKKEKKAKKAKQDAAPEAKEAPPPELPQPSMEQQPTKKTNGGSLVDFLPLVKVALDLLGDLRRKLRVDELYLRLILASSDPCDLAVNYGRTWAAVGNLIPQLERYFVIKKRDIAVECDFTAEKTLVYLQMKITITFGRLLSLLTIYGFRGLREFLKLKKKRKGGAAL